jgi:protein-L-isoaspartate(D-aspartate) O-methyltransferase
MGIFNFFPFFAERGILTSPEAASAMSKVDRKLFVPPTALPYKDSPQVIGKV